MKLVSFQHQGREGRIGAGAPRAAMATERPAGAACWPPSPIPFSRRRRRWRRRLPSTGTPSVPLRLTLLKALLESPALLILFTLTRARGARTAAAGFAVSRRRRAPARTYGVAGRDTALATTR